VRALEEVELERVCRVYRSNAEAAAALGVTAVSLARACRRHGIETPYARRLRQLHEAKGERRQTSVIGERSLSRGTTARPARRQ